MKSVTMFIDDDNRIRGLAVKQTDVGVPPEVSPDEAPIPMELGRGPCVLGNLSQSPLGRITIAQPIVNRDLAPNLMMRGTE